ncbi:MAG: hypothetical protein AAB652_01945 [Patescibacteria group bacterium]
MKFLQKISAEWVLRIFFAWMYLYSGVDIIQNPKSWTWAVPIWFNNFITQFMPIETYMRIQGVGEIIFALAFLAWFLKPVFLKYIALLASFEMAGILFLGKTGIDSITFRDIGLLGGLIALAIIFRDRSKATIQ